MRHPRVALTDQDDSRGSSLLLTLTDPAAGCSTRAGWESGLVGVDGALLFRRATSELLELVVMAAPGREGAAGCPHPATLPAAPGLKR